MKGIILAGGSGSRLKPLTDVVSKQLMPIYDKPLIFHPISSLMSADIRDIMIISNSNQIQNFYELLGDGSNYGLNFTYAEQEYPNGIAESFIIGEKFIGQDSVCLILGDNIFYGRDIPSKFLAASSIKDGGLIFGYKVKDPERFGVVLFDKSLKAIEIKEKPQKPKSSFAVTGVYFYDNQVVEFAKDLEPSQRGELEITDINNTYLKNGQLDVEILSDDCKWFDTGTNDSLLEASNFFQNLELKFQINYACLEEIAYKKNWISNNEFESACNKYKNSPYGAYLSKIRER